MHRIAQLEQGANVLELGDPVALVAGRHREHRSPGVREEEQRVDVLHEVETLRRREEDTASTAQLLAQLSLDEGPIAPVLRVEHATGEAGAGAVADQVSAVHAQVELDPLDVGGELFAVPVGELAAEGVLSFGHPRIAVDAHAELRVDHLVQRRAAVESQGCGARCFRRTPHEHERRVVAQELEARTRRMSGGRLEGRDALGAVQGEQREQLLARPVDEGDDRELRVVGLVLEQEPQPAPRARRDELCLDREHDAA